MSSAGRSAAWILAVLLPAALCGAAEKKAAQAPPQPAVRIPLAQLGFHGTPAIGLLVSRAATVTLDFIDNNHLLFTYAYHPLLTRDTGPPEPGEQVDRTVHAEIIELPTGKVDAEKDWRLHDREPYLWPVGDGNFLLRIGGRLMLLDRDLKETSVVETKSPIRWVQVDQGSNLLVIEVEREQHTKEQHEKLVHDALLSDAPPPAEDYDTFGLQFHSGQAEAQELFHVHLPQPGPLTGNEQWLLQEGPSMDGEYDIVALPLSGGGQEKHSVLRLKSECRPGMVMLGHDVALVNGCTLRGFVEYGVTLGGKTLWKRTVSAPLWPYYERAGNGSRFAVQRVSSKHGNEVNEDNLTEGEAEVFDVATGERMFAVPMSPLYSTRHTVALTADGMRVALLRRGVLEVYDLAPMRGKEKAASEAASAKDVEK